MSADASDDPRDPAARPLPGRILLVGLSGAGKSTVGGLLAERLGYAFVDLDREVERAAGRSVAVLFEEAGEAEFRRLEAGASEAARERVRAVVATGGGWMARDDLPRAWTEAVRVWLRVSPATAARRLGGAGDRPLLASADPEPALARLLEERRRAYAEAELAVETEGRSPAEVVDAILKQLPRTRLPRASEGVESRPGSGERPGSGDRGSRRSKS